MSVFFPFGKQVPEMDAVKSTFQVQAFLWKNVCLSWYRIMKFDALFFSLSIRILIGDTSGQIIRTSAEVTLKRWQKSKGIFPPKITSDSGLGIKKIICAEYIDSFMQKMNVHLSCVRKLRGYTTPNF